MEGSSYPRPDIGIMAHVRFADGAFQGKQGALLSEYLKIATQDKLSVCIFDLADVDTNLGVVSGYVLTNDGVQNHRLIKTTLQIPKVVYDQVLSRKYESTKRLAKKRMYLRNQAAIFNDGYFDKWKVYEWLSEDSESEQYLPRTALFSKQNARDFCAKYPVIFCKPIHGSLGRGIVKMVQKEEGWLVMMKQGSNRKEELHFHDSNEVFTHISTRLGKRPYILQEGIPLLEVHGRPLDVRVLLQKNELGEWKRTKTYVRVAAKGEYVSNLSSGGEAFALTWLKDILPDKKFVKIRKQIRYLINKLPTTIESKSKKTIGELGFDFGIDHEGHVFLLEVNSKPRKSIETVRGSAQLVEKALERPLLYALRLASSSDRGQFSNA